jgi:hypothetical protein
MAIPAALVLAPLWLLPASLYVHLEMTAPIFTWAVLMSLALNKIWRRHRLAQHGLDPNLVDTIKLSEPAAAFEWARSMQHPDRRTATVHSVLSAWASVDRDAAKAAAAAAGEAVPEGP